MSHLVSVRRAACFSLMLFAIVSPGCSGSSDDDDGPSGTVQGKVTLADRPLSAATITFTPASDSTLTKICYAELGEDGSYSLKAPSGSSRIPVGKYTVTIVAVASSSGDPKELMKTGAPAKGSKSPVPLKYQAPETSGLTRDVKETENSFDFPLKK